MEDKILKQSIERLYIKDEALKILKDNKTMTIKKLCGMKKKELKDMGIAQYQINDMELQLQLLGLKFKDSL